MHVVFLLAALNFAGVSWDATPDAIVKQLKESGFTQVRKSKHDVAFRGKFLNHDALGTATLAEKKLTKIVVMLAVTDPSPRTAYDEIRQELVEQYGEPAKTVAAFREPFHEGDGYEVEAIRAGGALFATQWRGEDGHSVTLSITPALAVAVTYE